MFHHLTLLFNQFKPLQPIQTTTTCSLSFNAICFWCNPFPAPSKTIGWCSTLALLLICSSRFDEMVVKHGDESPMGSKSVKKSPTQHIPKSSNQRPDASTNDMLGLSEKRLLSSVAQSSTSGNTPAPRKHPEDCLYIFPVASNSGIVSTWLNSKRFYIFTMLSKESKEF